MIESILNSHKLICQRYHVSWEYTPVKIVPEFFYEEDGKFNSELFNKVIAGVSPDKTQSEEERGAVGPRYLVHINKLRQLL